MTVYKIPLKTINKFDYKDVLTALISFGGEGISVPELESRIALLKELKVSDESVTLTKEQWQALKNIVELAKYKVACEEVSTFLQDVRNPEEVEVHV